MKTLLVSLGLCLSVTAFAFFYQFEIGSESMLAPDASELQSRPCWFTPEAGLQVACFNLQITEAGHQFTLPVVVLKAKQPSQQALLYLSGGPGGSTFLTADDMIYWQSQYARFAMQSDLILVDRRGTGMAEPRLQCPYFRREYRQGLTRDLSAVEENEQNFRAMSWCLNEQLSPAPDARRLAVDALGTAADARDMQTLVSLLGYQYWSLWGVSYGTRLALAIAAQQPQGLQSLVLDSVYPPGRGQNHEWPGLMSSAMTRFFTWCDNKACAAEPLAVADAGDLTKKNAEVKGFSERQFQQVLERLEARPVQLTLPSWYGEAPYQVVINGQRYLQMVFSAIYDQHLWPSIGESLSTIPSRQRAALSSLAESFVNNAFDPDFSELVFYAAECKDNAASATETVNAALAGHPYYSRYLDAQSQTDLCLSKLFLPVRGKERLPVADLANISIPVLMLSGEIDPITPIEWVEPLQALFPHWQLASFSDVGHAVVSSDMCAEQLLRDFVSAPQQPLALVDKSCRPSSVTLLASPAL